MKRTVVAEGLVLDEELYGLALEGLQSYVPELVGDFTYERFVDPGKWARIPDVENPDVPFYKAETILMSGEPYLQTVKLNYWVGADLRRDGAPMPHNHPWPFTGHVLSGGYIEDRYRVRRNEVQILQDPFSKWDIATMDLTEGVAHVAGTNNDIPLQTFHEVTEILEPGRTLSLMDCDLGRKEGWGHLEDNGRGGFVYVPNKQGVVDKRFKDLFFDRNPHLRQG